MHSLFILRDFISRLHVAWRLEQIGILDLTIYLFFNRLQIYRSLTWMLQSSKPRTIKPHNFETHRTQCLLQVVGAYKATKRDNLDFCLTDGHVSSLLRLDGNNLYVYKQKPVSQVQFYSFLFTCMLLVLTFYSQLSLCKFYSSSLTGWSDLVSMWGLCHPADDSFHAMPLSYNGINWALSWLYAMTVGSWHSRYLADLSKYLGSWKWQTLYYTHNLPLNCSQDARLVRLVRLISRQYCGCFRCIEQWQIDWSIT